MGVLDSVLRYKAQRDAEQMADVQAIPNALAAFQAGQQQRQKNLLDEMTLRISAASHGFSIDPSTGNIAKDESLISPTDQLIKFGSVAGAAKNIYEAGGPDLLGKFISPQQTPFSNYLPSQNLISQTSQVNPNSTAYISESESGNTKPGSIIPKDFDRFGRATGYKLVEPTESEKKRSTETEELASGLDSMVSLFRDAQSQRNEKFGEKPLGSGLPEGVQQKLSGKAAGVFAKAGASDLDAVDAFSRKRKTFATVLAKAAGEQRPTDEDVNRFMESLPSVDLPDATNERLIEALVNDLNSRGAKSVWDERIKGNRKSLNNKSEKNSDIKSFSSISEAEKSNLPKGTIIMIGGKKARID